jgi:hypothetical protein
VREADEMKRVMRLIVYMMPLVIVFLGEVLAKTEGSRAQIYVPLLALFPFLYFLQGMLVSFYGGNLHVAVMMTSISYAITLWLFLSPASWGMILIYLLVVFFLGLFLEMRHKN